MPYRKGDVLINSKYIRAVSIQQSSTNKTKTHIKLYFNGVPKPMLFKYDSYNTAVKSYECIYQSMKNNGMNGALSISA